MLMTVVLILVGLAAARYLLQSYYCKMAILAGLVYWGWGDWEWWHYAMFAAGVILETHDESKRVRRENQ